MRGEVGYEIEIELSIGEYEYKYKKNGEWITDQNK
jgi:hypothetical protein